MKNAHWLVSLSKLIWGRTYLIMKLFINWRNSLVPRYEASRKISRETKLHRRESWHPTGAYAVPDWGGGVTRSRRENCEISIHHSLLLRLLLSFLPSFLPFFLSFFLHPFPGETSPEFTVSCSALSARYVISLGQSNAYTRLA